MAVLKPDARRRLDAPLMHSAPTVACAGTLCFLPLSEIVPMTRTALLLALLALPAAPVLASSFAGSSAGSSAAGSSASSGSTSGDDKVVVQARDDAARFVASDGAIRGARLEAALRHLRETRQDARDASDLQLARGILAR